MIQDPRVPGWKFHKYYDGSIIISTLLFLISLIGFFVRATFLTGVILLICIGIWGVILYFFRDPDREIPNLEGIVLSPGDGVIRDITEFHDDKLNQDLIRVGIFLSLFDVHVQRIPLSGKVVDITHREGDYHPAFHPAASNENEQITMDIDTGQGIITVKQISGILARKCINYLAIGDQVNIGQRYGLIKFGSRVEIYFASSSQLQCTIGDKVKGGLTVIAELPTQGN